MRVIDKIAWIHLRNGQILCARSKGQDTYFLPGGKRDPGESDADTLAREIAEELSVRIEKETIHFFGVFEARAHGKSEDIMVRMTCYTANYSGMHTPASEIEEIAWLNYKDLHKVSQASQLIFEQLFAMKWLD
ncbi:NUDIX domain-containing protein [Paenibacillus zeisoli]|uniref:NUDIX domain-containing protein n=1 Tax=Paenibacillus zeisoli TaxID=2496267 RepID=A0A3S1BW48_9BACL|nr:NUDIX domain-containing protein [Paenibacillus zeisoli]RUT35672.1 NUDIX domain-containing protein [Paenibacillus zeisoli]